MPLVFVGFVQLTNYAFCAHHCLVLHDEHPLLTRKVWLLILRWTTYGHAVRSTKPQQLSRGAPFSLAVCEHSSILARVNHQCLFMSASRFPNLSLM
uniref:Putative secreted protein n=1 Tax=Ixodes ricinus TaxID=34613 RepID=A0A6B0UD55_IXORI